MIRWTHKYQYRRLSDRIFLEYARTPIITCTPRNTPRSLQAATVPSEPYRRRAFTNRGQK